MEHKENDIDWILLKDKKPADGQNVIIFEDGQEGSDGHIRPATYDATHKTFRYVVVMGDSTQTYIARGVSRWAE